MRLFCALGVAAAVPPVVFVLVWWVGVNVVGFDSGTVWAVAGAIAAIVLAPLAWWAPRLKADEPRSQSPMALPGLRGHFAQCVPEAQHAIAERQHRDTHVPAGEVAQQIRPRFHRLTIPIITMQAQVVLLQPYVHVDPVCPQVGRRSRQ